MRNLSKYFLMIAASSLMTLSADTGASEYSLFKRTISPAMNWGENGLLLVPKAQPIGKGNINLGVTSIDSGKINGEKLFLTTGTLIIGTSSDVEIGMSKRTFIWEGGERSDVEMDTFHLKARVLNFTDYYTPQLSVGVNGASLKANNFNNEDDIIYNPYAAVTLPIKFSDNFELSLTGVIEQVQSNSEKSDAVFSAGVDMKLWESWYIIAEAQGINQDEEDPVYNIGTKFTYGWFSIGAGLFNIAEDKVKSNDVGTQNNEEQYWMLHANLQIPLTKIFSKEQKKIEKLNNKLNNLTSDEKKDSSTNNEGGNQ